MAAIFNSGTQATSAMSEELGRVRHGSKCWGSRWNCVASSLRLVVISTSGYGGRRFDFGMAG